MKRIAPVLGLLVAIATSAWAQQPVNQPPGPVPDHSSDYCSPWNGYPDGKTPRPASQWDQCKEVAFIAGQIAELRDTTQMPEAEVASFLRTICPSLSTTSLDVINSEYVDPIYSSSEDWKTICAEFHSACIANNPNPGPVGAVK